MSAATVALFDITYNPLTVFVATSANYILSAASLWINTLGKTILVILFWLNYPMLLPVDFQMQLKKVSPMAEVFNMLLAADFHFIVLLKKNIGFKTFKGGSSNLLTFST